MVTLALTLQLIATKAESLSKVIPELGKLTAMVAGVVGKSDEERLRSQLAAFGFASTPR